MTLGEGHYYFLVVVIVVAAAAAAAAAAAVILFALSSLVVFAFVFAAGRSLSSRLARNASMSASEGS